MSYAAVYVFYVPKPRLAEFMQIQVEAMEVYREYGVSNSATYEAADMTPKYLCSPLSEGLRGIGPEEVAVLGVDQFKDRQHLEAVMEKIDADERITLLVERLTDILGKNVEARAFRGEFLGV